MNRSRRMPEFPWREGNRIELLIDGPQFFPAVLKAIAGARRDVMVEMYLIESSAASAQLIDALVAAATRRVRTRLLLDGYGALDLRREDRERLVAGGVALVYFNPLRYEIWWRNLFRDHRKLVAVDGEIAFVGGAGITDEFADGTWRETMVQVTGPNVADWCRVFENNWRRWSIAAEPRDWPVGEAGGAQSGRVMVSGRLGSGVLLRGFIQRIHATGECVWMATAYFVPSWKLRHALRYGARRGLDVRLLLPGPVSDHPGVRHAGRRYYNSLLRAGVRIFEYQPRFMHAKVLLCDDWVSIGSSNMDRWNLRWNQEGNQEVQDRSFAAQVRAMFVTDFAQSREITLDEWQQRPWWKRWREWYWGQVDFFLDDLGRRLHAWHRRKQ